MSDYELIPNKELLRLRKEIDRLKSGKEGSDITETVESLTKSIETLNELFFAATQEMKAEEKSEHTILRKIEPLFDKLDEISEQNTKIARAIIALTDMIKEHRPSAPMPRPAPRPLFRQTPASPAPSFSPPPRFTPPGPPSAPRKKGLFK